MTHHDRLIAAYPGLLPGFFTATEDHPYLMPSRLRLVVPHLGDDARALENEALDVVRQAYLLECARAISVLFEHADALAFGDSVVISAALSQDRFERLCALGAELAELEDDDPAEDADHDEDDGLAEEWLQPISLVVPKKETAR